MFVITGGSRGIGKALAVKLAKSNKKVLIVGRNQELLEEVSLGSPNIDFLCADVSKQEGREKILSFINHNELSLDGLVNNAGVIGPIKPIASIAQSEWVNTMMTNVDPALFLTQLLIDKLKNKKILNIGSGAQYFPVLGWAAYCVSKAALAMLTKCWQLEHEDSAFACVLPGIIDTDMQADIRNASDMDPKKLLFFKNLYENQQLLSTQTVADFLSWLLIDVGMDDFKLKEWDIYDKSHHKYWLDDSNVVPDID